MSIPDPELKMPTLFSSISSSLAINVWEILFVCFSFGFLFCCCYCCPCCRWVNVSVCVSECGREAYARTSNLPVYLCLPFTSTGPHTDADIVEPTNEHKTDRIAFMHLPSIEFTRERIPANISSAPHTQSYVYGVAVAHTLALSFVLRVSDALVFTISTKTETLRSFWKL